MNVQVIRAFTLIMCLLAAPGAAMAEDFSWQAHLGISPENLRTELEKFSACDFIKPLSFLIRYPISPSAKIAIGNWHNPMTGGGFFNSEDAQQSSMIRELNCSADMSVRIHALVFENIVFDITLDYGRCDRRNSHCDPLVPTSIDKFFASKLPEKIIYDPIYGNGSTNSNTELYHQTYSSMLSDLYLHNMLSDAGNCVFRTSVGLYPSGKYRCIITATADDGIWHAITMTEVFESGFFSERLLGRLANSQQFTLIEVDKRARAAFTSEVQAAIDNRDRLDKEKNRIKELRENPLQNVR